MQVKVSQNMSLKLLSFLIACVLWFAVLGSRNVEVTKEIPVEIITSPDLMVANDVPDKVVFRMSGPKAFLRNILNRKEEPIRVNFTTAKPGFTTYRLFQDNIQVPIGVKVLSVNPASLVVKLEPVKHKEVPIRLVTKGAVATGYSIAKLELLQNTIKLKGPESNIDTVREVLTAPVNLSDVFDSGIKEATLDLSDAPGVVVESELPKIHFEVTQTTANFKIRNVDVKIVSSRRSTVDPKEVVIFVKCSPEELKTINRTKVFVTVDMKNKGAGTYEESVNAQLPANIKLMKVVPQKVKVTLY